MTRVFLCAGNPTPDVNWYKDGTKLKPKKKDKRLQLDWNITDDIHTLILTDITVDDSGEYKIEVTNEKGKIETSVSVKVSSRKLANDQEDSVDAANLVESNILTEAKNILTEEDSRPVELEKTALVEEKVVQQAVIFESAPAFELLPVSVSPHEGETIKLSCKISG